MNTKGAEDGMSDVQDVCKWCGCLLTAGMYATCLRSSTGWCERTAPVESPTPHACKFVYDPDDDDYWCACGKLKPELYAPAVPVEERAAMPTREAEGSWPDPSLQRAFVEGMKWWQFHSNGSTAFPSERDEAEKEALRRYGIPEERTAEMEELVGSARRFIAKLEQVEPVINGLISLQWARTGHGYTGPNYVEEKTELVKLLDNLEGKAK